MNDKDLVHFTGGFTEDLQPIKGITCQAYSADENDGIPVHVGSEFCKHCPMCYGYKIRWWHNKDTGNMEYDGYVKCANDNRTLVNRIKCWWWHKIKKERSNIKYFYE